MLDRTVRALLDDFASTRPTPAGGAAAVLAAAMGTALGLKVVRISVAKSDKAARSILEAAATRLERLADELPPRFEEDCAAFEAVLAERRTTPRDPLAEATAWKAATDVPMNVLRLAREALAALESVGEAIRAAVRSDHAAAATLLRSAAEIAGVTANANAPAARPAAG